MRTLFLIVSSLGLIMALGTVLARNLVHAALFLVGFFFLVACQFILLEAEFMAAMQVLVYIGAVAILLMFGIMLTRNIQGDETTGGHWARKLPAVIVALGLLIVLMIGILDEKSSGGQKAWKEMTTRPALTDASGKPTDRAPAINNMGRVVGDEMMTRFIIAFEVAGLLLTAALVGAIALAQADPAEELLQPGAARTARVGGDGQGEGPASATSVGGSTESSRTEAPLTTASATR